MARVFLGQVWKLDCAELPVPVQEIGLRRDLAEHHATPAEVQLGLVTDEDQLERDHALARRGWLDEQPSVELERERPLAAAAHRIHRNAEMPSAVQRATCKLDSLGKRTLADLVEKRRSFAARSIDRLIKVARTIADLLGQDDIDAGCLLEAAAYREVGPTANLVPHVM